MLRALLLAGLLAAPARARRAACTSRSSARATASPRRARAPPRSSRPSTSGPPCSSCSACQPGSRTTDGHWKLIQRLSGEHELYELDADPKEQSDLWPPDAGAEADAAAALQAVIDANR